MKGHMRLLNLFDIWSFNFDNVRYVHLFYDVTTAIVALAIVFVLPISVLGNWVSLFLRWVFHIGYERVVMFDA